MKSIITLLFVTYFAICANAQKVDWVKAPRNPITFYYKLEHFGLKKDVQIYKQGSDYYQFDKKGLLSRKIIKSGLELHNYIYDANNMLVGFMIYKKYNNKVGVTMVKPIYSGTNIIKFESTDNWEVDGSEFKKQYEYKNGLLTAIKAHSGDLIASFEYDLSGRLIKKIDNSYASLGMAFEILYSYENEKNNLKITSISKNPNNPNEKPTTNVDYVNGLGIEDITANFSNVKSDAFDNKLDSKNENMGYQYFNGTKTGASFSVEVISSKSSLKTVEELYAGLPNIDSNCRGNCTDGFGDFKQKNGDLYRGFWLENKPNGYGEYTFSNGNTYTGNFESGNFSGLGMYTYDNKTKLYAGEFKHGGFNGFGTLSDETKKNNISGTFKDSKLVLEITATGLTKGCVRGNCINGYGEYIFENGEKFIGEFANEFAVKGVRNYTNGNIYLGEFSNDKFNNFGLLFNKSPNATKYSGFWKQGLYHGKGSLSNKQTYQKGEFSNGIFIKDLSQ